MYRNWIKPFSDRSIAFLLIFLISPLLLCIILGLYFGNKKQVFFKQERPGKNGKMFSIYKLKTMTDERDSFGNLLPDEDRMTKIGKFIRSTSMDEIPQLWNVLKGDMSLIGPRPLLISYLELYTDQQKRRHLVKPGITGWAQVNGRNAISWKEKFQLDEFYVDKLSLSLDLKILFLTIKKVFLREGISQKGQITITPFNGSN